MSDKNQLKQLIENYGRACRAFGTPAWESKAGEELSAALATLSHCATQAETLQAVEWERLRENLALAMLGFASREGRKSLEAAEQMLDALADGPMPYLRAALAAKQPSAAPRDGQEAGPVAAKRNRHDRRAALADWLTNRAQLHEWLADGAKLHPHTLNLVVQFARALAEKLAAAEKKYGYGDGWLQTDWMDECREKLMEHVAKGDPRDVAAYCAFLWHHGESTAAPGAAIAAREQEERERFREKFPDGSAQFLAWAWVGWETRAALASNSEASAAPSAEEPSEKQKTLLDLADRIDHEQLWRVAGIDHSKFTPEQKDRLDAGVALRRYGQLWAPGRWIVFPPVGPVQYSAGTLDAAYAIAKKRENNY